MAASPALVDRQPWQDIREVAGAANNGPGKRGREGEWAEPLVMHRVPDCSGYATHMFTPLSVMHTQSETHNGTQSNDAREHGTLLDSSSQRNFRHACGVLFHKNFLARATHVLQNLDWLDGSAITSSLGDGPEAMHSFNVSQMGTHLCLSLRISIGLAPSFSFICSRILALCLGYVNTW